MIQRDLVFLHVSRSKNWSLHLHATEELYYDIRSMDRTKYARLIPVYLAEMQDLQRTDPVIWEAFSRGEFSVQKTPIPYTALGMDHAGEQVNKTIKIEGGLTGVSRNENARTRYFLTAPIISKIASNFKAPNTAKKHHQNNRAYSTRQTEMKEKLVAVLRQHNVTFDQDMGPEMHNFITKQVFPEEITTDVLSVEKVGKDGLKTFVEERLAKDATTSIWAPSRKMNLKLCFTANKAKKTKLDDKIINLQSERMLFSRCAIVANSDRDLDMMSVIGNYELDVIPRSLMTGDGSLYPGCDNKSDLVECLTDEYSSVCCPSVAPTTSPYRVAIIDAMVVVQKIVALDKKAKPGKKIKTCLDFFLNFSVRLK